MESGNGDLIRELYEKRGNKTPETRKNLLELKNILEVRARMQRDIAKSVSESIQSEGFRGEKIQVIPDTKDKTIIHIKTSHAQIQLYLHYDETREHMDSLRKESITYPEIFISGGIDDTLYEIEGYDEKTSARIAGELLKQIERKKYPQLFGYTEIQLGLLDDNTIIIGGKREDGKVKRLGFFEYITDEKDRIMLYGYIAHTFGKPLDPKMFEEIQSGDTLTPNINRQNQGQDFI